MRSPDVVVLTPQDVRGLLTMGECIGAVEEAFCLHGEGETDPPAVLSVHVPGGGFHIKAGVLGLRQSYFVAKVNGNFPENPARLGLPTIQGVIVLCDAERGSPLAVMDSRDVTALRTAAATAVAAKYLARQDSRTVTICGCGQQGRVQLEGLLRVLVLKSVFAYDKDADRARVFARQAARELGIIVDVASDLSTAAKQSDICVTCTTSREPLLGTEDIRPGTFIAAVGADNPHKQELDPILMAKSKVVCDIVEQCAVMGDLHHALESHVMSRDDIHAELGEVVVGRKSGRESVEEITIFDSTGMALQDVATAALVYERAQQQGTGVRLDFAA
jgi:alanine dehydrogenase